MKIMIIGKYPPIQGGESGKAYWFARGLSEAGDSVTVISNSMEVEREYRCDIKPSEVSKLKPDNVDFYSTNPFTVPSFIPQFNPYTERLTNLGLEIGDKFKPDIILGWYLLPYGVAAQRVAQELNLPYMFQHAGSDLARLLSNGSLARILGGVLNNASGVFSYGSADKMFESRGVENIERHSPMIPPAFSSEGNMAELEGNKVVSFYGKLARTKGVDYLLNMMRHIPDVDLHLFGSGRGANKYIDKYGKQNNLHFHRPIPIWRVPDTMRGSDAVIVPENDFDVAGHTTRIPLEAICCETPLILSDQVVAKSPYNRLEGCYKTINPQDSKGSALKIQELVYGDTLPISSRQAKVRGEFTKFGDYIQGMREILGKYAK